MISPALSACSDGARLRLEPAEIRQYSRLRPRLVSSRRNCLTCFACEVQPAGRGSNNRRKAPNSYTINYPELQAWQSRSRLCEITTLGLAVTFEPAHISCGAPPGEAPFA